MFDIKELTTAETGGFSGEAALNSMQNAHTFSLDLLVRESIQNSSDATIDNSLVFNVFYSVGKFRNDDLTPYLGAENNQLVEQRLNERFSGKELSFLEVRDSKTNGLNGEVLKSKCTNDTKSNFLRLIFEMGKGQDKANAGGKWGYGKTVYYRLGLGIVIYYSRTKNDNGMYESRLILTLIENEKKPDALLRNNVNNSAGRAWWGEKNSSTGDICPTTNDEIIRDFLGVFGLESFAENETGTSIIIPYIDEAAIMEEAKTGFKGEESMIDRCSFLSSVSNYLKYAVQKWYAPILNNFGLRKYGRKFLNAYINGELIGKDDLYPIFRLVQELYSTAYAKLKGATYQSEFQILSGETNGYYKRHLCKFGHVAFSKIQREELEKNELLLSPNVYMNLSDDEFVKFNKSISLCARELGMVLNYEENWVDNEVLVEPDEILVTFFVPDINIVEDYGMGPEKLGDYLREREEADHMKWDDDPARMKIKCVNLIKKSVKTSVKSYYNPEQAESHGESNMSEFAGVLGEKLFPLGKKSKPKVSGGGVSGGGVSRSEKRFNFFTKGISITAEGRIKVLYELELKEKASVAIKTKVSSDVAIDAEKWAEKIGTAYPLKVIGLIIATQEKDNKIVIVEKNNEVLIDGDANKISGSFEIESSDKKLAFVIDCEEKKEEDN